MNPCAPEGPQLARNVAGQLVPNPTYYVLAGAQRTHGLAVFPGRAVLMPRPQAVLSKSQLAWMVERGLPTND